MIQQAKTVSDTHFQIEKFGLEAIPEEMKKTSFSEYFMLQLAFSVNSGNFLLPALAVITGGLSFLAAVVATVFGAALAYLFVSALSLPGAKYGLPAQYAIRSFLGIQLSRYAASPIRTITSLYWFCVQTIGGTIVFTHLIQEIFGVKIPFTPIALIFAMTMGMLALYGFDTVKKTVKLFLPVLIIGQIVLLFFFIQSASKVAIPVDLFHTQWSYGNFLLFASLAFVQYISGVSASSDMARYAKSASNAFWGLFVGNTCGFFMTAVLAAFSASLFGEWNPFVAAITASNSKLFLVLILLCSMTSMIFINMNNAYTGGFSLLNTFQGLGRIKSSIIFGIAAVTLSAFPILVKEAQLFISYLGAFIIPVSAVITIDFLLIKKASLPEELLQKVVLNTYHMNRNALYSMIIGSSVYLLLPKASSPGFITFFITCCLYFILHRIHKEKVIAL